MTPNSPPSLRQIAAKAGVSHVTVSLALRGDPRLPLETRQRIQQIAKELGYRPNLLVHALMAQVRAQQPVRQREVLAFVTAFPSRDEWRKTEIFRDYFEGAAERATQLGCELEHFWAKEPGMTGRRLTQILTTRHIRGVLVEALPVTYGHLSLDWSRFAAATFGYSFRRPALHRAVPDAMNNFTTGLRHLRRFGYRRIGIVVLRDASERVNQAYLGAFLAYQHGLRAADRVPPLLLPKWENQRHDGQFRRWFRRHRPDAVFGCGCGMIPLMRDCGRRVPQDVGYAEIARLRSCRGCAGMDTNTKLVGAAAVDIVVKQLYRNEFGVPTNPYFVHVAGAWVDGNTAREQR